MYVDEEGKGKKNRVQPWTCHNGPRRMTAPNFRTHEGDKVVSPRSGRLKTPGTHFC